MEALHERITPFAYPNLTEAAGMVGVKPSVLSRRPDLAFIAAGREQLAGAYSRHFPN